MTMYAIYVDGELVALFTEEAPAFLIHDAWYAYKRDTSSDLCELEVDKDTWQRVGGSS